MVSGAEQKLRERSETWSDIYCAENLPKINGLTVTKLCGGSVFAGQSFDVSKKDTKVEHTIYNISFKQGFQ
jgi:hypothetical protein